MARRGDRGRLRFGRALLGRPLGTPGGRPSRQPPFFVRPNFRRPNSLQLAGPSGLVPPGRHYNLGKSESGSGSDVCLRHALRATRTAIHGPCPVTAQDVIFLPRPSEGVP
jgi:hypothetical protein